MITPRVPDCCALIPLKRAGDRKSRLAGVLSTAARLQLADTLLGVVLAAVRSARRVATVIILTPEPFEAPAGVEVMPDLGGGLNHELGRACSLLRARGLANILVVPADLPYLTAAEVDALIETGTRSGFAIAPDRHGEGTNGLFLGSPADFAFQFGASSFQKHLAIAGSHHPGDHVVVSPGFSFDIDSPEDLRDWERSCRRRQNCA